MREKLLRFIKEYREVNLPQALKTHYNSLLILAIAVMIGGVSVTLMFSTDISLISFPIIIGVGIIGFAFYYKASIVINAYVEIEGIVIDYQNYLPKGISRNTVDSFILQTSDGLFDIPSAKKKQPVPIGSSVTVYISPSAKSYVTRDGYIKFTTIYGYEVNGFVE